jgi:hypothetical protein
MHRQTYASVEMARLDEVTGVKEQIADNSVQTDDSTSYASLSSSCFLMSKRPELALITIFENSLCSTNDHDTINAYESIYKTRSSATTISSKPFWTSVC